MKLKVFKGCHYGVPFFPKFFFNKKKYEEEMTVKFDNSCLYRFDDEDQHDVNKLFGISYGLHHTNSDRIGWRNIPDGDGIGEIEIVKYSYSNGVRKPSNHLAWVKVNEPVKIKLRTEFYKKNERVDAFRDLYIAINDVCVYSNTLYCEGKLNWLWYTLGLYFGGNRRAPHTITIEKIK